MTELPDTTAVKAASDGEHMATYDTRTHCLMNGAELADLYTLIEGGTRKQEATARKRLRAFFDAHQEVCG